jgi:hypothetical protein
VTDKYEKLQEYKKHNPNLSKEDIAQYIAKNRDTGGKSKFRSRNNLQNDKRANRKLAQIGVENRDYHYLSHFEIAGGKRISQHLSSRCCETRFHADGQ